MISRDTIINRITVLEAGPGADYLLNISVPSTMEVHRIRRWLGSFRKGEWVQSDVCRVTHDEIISLAMWAETFLDPATS